MQIPFMIISLVCLGSVLIYCVALAIIRKGIPAKAHEPISDGNNKNGVSIVIAFRNEEKNLPGLLHCIETLVYPHYLLEIILIDDHSEDGSLELVSDWKVRHLSLKVKIFELEKETGKKQALRYGIRQAGMEFILCTDADCLMGSQWVRLMVTYCKDYNKKIVLGPVGLLPHDTFLDQFQHIETLGLQAITAGTASIGRAVMGNGANLLFLKSIIADLEKDHPEGESYSSGDDVFLIHAVKRRFGGNSIGYLLEKEALVLTAPAPSWSAMLWQHVRWAGKSKGYRDKDSLMLGSITVLVNLLPVPLLCCTMYDFTCILTLTGSLFLKGGAELLLINKYRNSIQYSFKPIYFAGSVILYPIFTVSVIIVSLFGRYRWKGRWVR